MIRGWLARVLAWLPPWASRRRRNDRGRSGLDGLFNSLDETALQRLGLSAEAASALARANTHAGAEARAQMVRALVPQTGLKSKVIVKALRERRAEPDALTDKIRSHGGDVRLKYFGTRAPAQGAPAPPGPSRSGYPHTFMREGGWLGRVVKPNWNGQVFERLAHGMTAGDEARAFVARDAVAIPDRLSDLRRALASVIGRERVALQEIEFREGCPRPGCRPVGLEWAYDQLFLDAAALQQLDALLAALEPHEAVVRALLASPAPVLPA